MLRKLIDIFSSPDKFLNLISARNLEEDLDDKERIFIDEDGTAFVNPHSDEVKKDFARHVEVMRNI
ncbi:MAG: hypothetical protein E6560_02725 [Yersiniaceae bacterium]|uniref:Uncharacterized protein n=1 Tax=Chimaeribacter coloradensis TaxID=2060068 RepID=A0A2N5E7S7_9GAMM|nr:hypothetical protein [Chimaeribacter coloradensis]MDU6409870.1 hypothetical protein [Yersiniaceae bacterium]PLR37537.1 hypothetical protein CYR32_06920 [Chimaeribacter coloradensis]